MWINMGSYMWFMGESVRQKNYARHLQSHQMRYPILEVFQWCLQHDFQTDQLHNLMMMHKTALPLTALVICHLVHLRHLKHSMKNFNHHSHTSNSESSVDGQKGCNIEYQSYKSYKGVGSLVYLTCKRLPVITLHQGQNIQNNVPLKTSRKWS